MRRLRSCAAKLGADEDQQVFFGAKGVAEGGERGWCRRRLRGGGGVVAGEVGGERAVAELGDVEEGFGLAAELDLGGVGDVELCAVEADVGAEVPGGERGLVGGVAADEQDGFGGEGVAQGGGAVWCAC